MPFQKFELHTLLLKGINTCGFESPTEIQEKALPLALQGQDIIATAQTGTGKTAAFVIPALQQLAKTWTVQRNTGITQTLVLTPTRELANQVTENIRQLGRFMRIRYANIVGGVPYPPQIRLLSQALDIIIATPGRLIDHLNNGRVDLSQIKIFVLDEADRMLDMGFVNDVKTIAQQLPEQRQTLLFSATFEKEVQDIAQQLLTNPVKIELTHAFKKHEAIKQHILQADDYSHKHALLRHILKDRELQQAVVFTSTKRSAEKLADQLNERGFKSAVLHGDMKQTARKRTIDIMKRNHAQVLVATDVAARGLDIKTITHVVNFDLPQVAEDYIHRIGRTGRAGMNGIAFSLVGPSDWAYLYEIEKFTGNKISQTVIEGLEPRLAKPGLPLKRPHSAAQKRQPVKKHKRNMDKPPRPKTGRQAELKKAASQEHSEN
ncbi:MAG: DEAD/DEAH box helicase [Gammaproteobacteria bacterium]|nr:DEAD/DEAH box helicase [Gammaproteobacteria bacterium]